MRHLDDTRQLRHHAFVIEAEAEEGIEVARTWAEMELGMKTGNNPDIVELRYRLLSVEDARRVAELAAGKAFAGDTKVVIIAASRVYHEAQNALLKLFEEPPRGTYLFLVVPTLGGLLPTLRSRVQEISLSPSGRTKIGISWAAEEFLKTSREKRTALIKKLASGKDEEERRENREQAIQIINGIEAAAYRRGIGKADAALLSDIAALRAHLYDRSAPVKMILEHLSLVTQDDLI